MVEDKAEECRCKSCIAGATSHLIRALATSFFHAKSDIRPPGPTSARVPTVRKSYDATPKNALSHSPRNDRARAVCACMFFHCIKPLLKLFVNRVVSSFAGGLKRGFLKEPTPSPAAFRLHSNTGNMTDQAAKSAVTSTGVSTGVRHEDRKRIALRQTLLRPFHGRAGAGGFTQRHPRRARR